jgi:hypothetical protein
LRAQVVGRGGDNVKYIQQETGCKVQIKGRGSGFMEPQSGQESEEPMYLHIAYVYQRDHRPYADKLRGPRQEGVDKAKDLCEGLLAKVKDDYEAYKNRPMSNRYGGDRDGYGGGRPGYGDRGDRSERGDRGDRDRSQSYGYGGGYGSYGAPGAGDVQSPAAAADPNAQAANYEQYAQWAAYYAQNPEQDPYAAYGGFAAMMAQYSQGGYGGQYYGQQGHAAGQTQSPAPGAAAAAPPPPPPPAEPSGYGAPPPPPPPASSPPAGYGSVCIRLLCHSRLLTSPGPSAARFVSDTTIGVFT